MECDIIFCHFGSFFPFYPTIECKKIPGDIILLNMSNIQEDHMMYGLWDKRRNVQSVLSFWAILCPLTLLTTQKIKIKKNKQKKQKNAWRYYRFTLVYHNWWSYVWFLTYGELQTECIIILDHFLPFMPLTIQEIKILKKWRKQVQISSFNTSAP